MDENTKEVLSPEEQRAEQEALVVPAEEEVRAKVIEEFGFDPETQADLIDKAVAKDMKHRTDLSKAIGQKVKIRTEKDALLNKVTPPAPQKKETPSTEDIEKIIDQKTEEKLAKRDLDSLDLPEDIKKEIARVAQISGISIKEAAADPYIKSRIDAHRATVEAEEAALGRNNNKRSGSPKYSLDNPPEVDMSTEEGRKEWDSYLKWAEKQPGMQANS